MALEDELLGHRYERAARIRELGYEPYGHAFTYTHTIPAILSTYGRRTAEELADRIEVQVAGRIQTIRRMGKAGFLNLIQGGSKIQVYIKKDAVNESNYKLYELLDIGDIIAVRGYLFRTKTGELTIHADELFFLSKILLALPEKWHGLEDVEIRYRQRYLDLIATPELRNVFTTRAKIITSLRRQLDERGFLEVETPMMQPLHGGAVARPFVTHHNALDMDLYLRIAPELYLKRLLVGGIERVYEINRNFRNEGLGWRWNPEFTMLEFYQAYADYRILMDLSIELLHQTAIDATGSATVPYQGRTIDFSHCRRYSMRESLVEFWPSNDKPNLENVKDPEWLLGHSKETTPALALVDIFERCIESQLVEPTIIYDYPAEISPLSKNKSDEPEFVERFEIYIAGMEIGNAFTELNDPQEQRRRFELQIARKASGDEEAHVMDEDYIRALSYGMPPAAGEGVGIDRLTMLLTDSRTIRDVILFPLLRPEGEIGLVERFRELDGSEFRTK
ncbi:MAG: lysine--tRNA ligase [Acidobacteriaceae bacterium]|nr:lysine--tRNA ligase [Acidobacteriaceae bacterium]MBV9778994.1 lysine--tRNA ligase [Acidobacteriaceae bacterium]